MDTEGKWSCLFPARSINNDLVKYIPQGAIGDQEEMAQLDGEQVLCCGPEAPASFAGEQWGEWGDAAVHPQQEQLADPHVQPTGRDPGHLRASPGDATSSPDAAMTGPDAAAAPTLVPMTVLTDPLHNSYPEDTTMETQLGSNDPKQPLVWFATTWTYCSLVAIYRVQCWSLASLCWCQHKRPATISVYTVLALTSFQDH